MEYCYWSYLFVFSISYSVGILVVVVVGVVVVVVGVVVFQEWGGKVFQLYKERLVEFVSVFVEKCAFLELGRREIHWIVDFFVESLLKKSAQCKRTKINAMEKDEV